MGNTCGTCAFDNRGTEVDMKQTKEPSKPGKGNYGQGAGYSNATAFTPEVNVNNLEEFLEPPEYQCDAVMVRLFP